MAALKQLKPNFPDEPKRILGRMELRKSDGIAAVINNCGGCSFAVTAFDMSSFGACIQIPNYVEYSGFVGETVEMRLQLPEFFDVTVIARIRWKKNNPDGVRCGLEFTEQILPIPSGLPLPDDEFALKIPDFYSLAGFFYKPFSYFERCNLRIVGLSETIWKIIFYDSEMALFKAQKIDIWLVGLGPRAKPVRLEVLGLNHGSGPEISAQCKVEGLSRTAREWIAHQLIFICDLTPVQIRRIGFDTERVSNGFRFRFVKTQNEYEGVLRLRFKAYLAAGKVDPLKSYLDMVAPMDPKSRILICYHGEKVVASVAISFPSDESEILDTERPFPNGYPVKIPEKAKIVEISRLCTDSDYRRTDLLNRVFEYTYKVTICGNREFILTSTDAKLWKIYKKLGFKKTGMSYAHPYLSGLEHHIIIGRRDQPDLGKDLSPLSWNYLWRDMNSFLEQRGFVKKTFSNRIRIAIFVMIGKILRIQIDRQY